MFESSRGPHPSFGAPFEASLTGAGQAAATGRPGRSWGPGPENRQIQQVLLSSLHAIDDIHAVRPGADGGEPPAGPMGPMVRERDAGGKGEIFTPGRWSAGNASNTVPCTISAAPAAREDLLHPALGQSDPGRDGRDAKASPPPLQDRPVASCRRRPQRNVDPAASVAPRHPPRSSRPTARSSQWPGGTRFEMRASRPPRTSDSARRPSGSSSLASSSLSAPIKHLPRRRRGAVPAPIFRGSAIATGLTKLKFFVFVH